MTACTDRCRDEGMHEFFVAGGNFRWCWPKVDRLHTANPHAGFILNRYPHQIIGVALYIGRRGIGIRWKSS